MLYEAHAQSGSEWGLTPRSTGAPTAGRQARSVARYILHSPGLAPSRRRPVNSNVRQHGNSMSLILSVADPAALSNAESFNSHGVKGNELPQL